MNPITEINTFSVKIWGTWEIWGFCKFFWELWDFCKNKELNIKPLQKENKTYIITKILKSQIWKFSKIQWEF